MKAVLVRHTRLADVSGLCYGRADVALADTFTDEARALLDVLPWKPREVWSSPTARCRVLADVLSQGAPVRWEARLQELSFGEWEGRRWEAFWGPESETWALDPWTRRPPGGETALELWTRVAAMREQVRSLADDARVLIVTHAGVIRMWRRLAEGGTPGTDVFSADASHGQVWPAD